jgi:hypothetical protein
MTHGDWQNTDLRCLGALFGKSGGSGRLLLMFNAGGALNFSLPATPSGQTWTRQFDTSQDAADVTELRDVQHYPLGERSAVLLEC